MSRREYCKIELETRKKYNVITVFIRVDMIYIRSVVENLEKDICRIFPS